MDLEGFASELLHVYICLEQDTDCIVKIWTYSINHTLFLYDSPLVE